MKKVLFAITFAAAATMVLPADAAEPAVYRPGVNDASVEEASWRGRWRRNQRQFNRAQRDFRRDYNDFRDDYRDYRRDTYRSNRYRGRYGYGYSPYQRYSRPGVRIGNFGFYW